MKKLIFCLTTLFLSLTFLPLQSNAAEKIHTTLTAPIPAKSSNSKILELRLNEINKMDKSSLKTSEKRNLRKETKSLERQRRHDGGVYYISGGTILLIIVLLIIL